MKLQNSAMLHGLLVLVLTLSSLASCAWAQNSATPVDKPMPMVTIQGDKFVADGKEFKIWGFNQGHGLHLPDSLLKKNADQLAFLGVNMLRLHTIDWTYWGDSAGPSGESLESGLLPTGLDRKDTQHLVNVDKFYRFMNALREKGIYVAITLSVCSDYVPGDVDILQTTPEDAEAWKQAIAEMNTSPGATAQSYKILPVIDERSLALRKAWITNLMNLRNPQTGVRMAEDPQLALLNTVNEDSMWSAFFRNNYMKELPPYFLNKAQKAWNDWLKAKYKTNDALAQAWVQEGKKGLLSDESLEAGTVKLLPIDSVTLSTEEEKKDKSYEYYSKQRYDDYIQFLFEMDAAHQRELNKHLKELGWNRPAGYGDSVGIGPDVGKLWLESDLLPYIEEHPYDEGVIDLFMWDKLRVCTYCGSNYLPWQGQDRPMWGSEIHCIDGASGWTRVIFPYYVAIYHSLQGRDGCTWHVWTMHREHQLKGELMVHNLGGFHCNWDIPLLFAYRAAGRLFKSCEIQELPKDDPARERFSRWEANITNDQVHRLHGAEGNAITTVNTKHFRAVATPYARTVQLGDVTIDLTSQTANLVIVEILSPDEIEITAVGKCGEVEKGKENHFDPLEYVTGSVKVAGRTVESIQHIDHYGNVIETVEGSRADVPLVPGIRLYRAKLK